MEKIAIFLLLAFNGLTDCTNPSKRSSNNHNSNKSPSSSPSRSTKQLFYSPFLFPGNYGAGFPVANTDPAANNPNLSALPANFWSNLQTVPVLHSTAQQNGLRLTSQVPAVSVQQQQQQQPALQYIALNPQQLNGYLQGQLVPSSSSSSGGLRAGSSVKTQQQQQQQPLAFSRVHHGNIWNFDDSTPNKDDSSSKRDALQYYFPFANPQFGSYLDKAYHHQQQQESMSNSRPVAPHHRQAQPHHETGFQRGNIESRPYEATHHPVHRDSGSSSNHVGQDFGGFVRGHVEAPPSSNGNNNKNHYGAGASSRHHSHEESSAGSVSSGPSSFNRGAVEGVPSGLGRPSDYDAMGYNARANGDKKVVCYFANWAWNRKGKAAFYPEHIDPQLCTHVIYAFSTYDKSKGTIAPSDIWTDTTQRFYDRIVALKMKNPDLKVLLSIGGWADSGDDKYSNLAHSPTARSKFARESMNYLKMHGFDGLAVDWHYPKCWQSNCDAGPGSDSTAFGDLLRELRNVYQPQGLLLSATLSGYKEVIDVAYHVPTLSKLLDLMNIMVYDYHGAWESNTGHVAPLFQGPQGYDKFPHYNANFTMEYYVSLGADRSKLIMGIPMYGQSFVLKQRGNTHVGTEADGPGEPGEFTSQPGMLAYYEICERVRNRGWTVVKDRTSSWGPIAYDSNTLQWVGYDDPEFVGRKARFALQRGFGGAFVWTMDLDDFNNDCCGGSQPLLRTVAKEILNIPFNDQQMGCNPPPPIDLPPVQGAGSTTVPRPTTPSSAPPQANEPTASSVWWRPTTTTSSSTTSTTSTTTTSRPFWWTSTTSMPPREPPQTSVTWWPTTSTTTMTPSTSTVPPTTTSSFTQPPYTTPSTLTSQTPPPSTTVVLTCVHQVPSQNHPGSPMPTPWPNPTTPVGGTPQPGEYCDGSTFVTQADKKDCTTYYICLYNRLERRRCPSGLQYNDNAQTCDWPNNAMCSRDQETSLVMTTPRTTTTVSHWQQPSSTYRPLEQELVTMESTECANGDYLPAEDCSSYYLCTMGRKTLQRCGSGLHWNREKKLCDWPSAANCQSAPVSNKIIQAIDRPIIRDEPCREGEFYPSSSDCSVYYICDHGRKMRFTCQGGLYWNQAAKVCDWPNNAGCTLGAATPVGTTMAPPSWTTSSPAWTSTMAPTWTTSTTSSWQTPPPPVQNPWEHPMMTTTTQRPTRPPPQQPLEPVPMPVGPPKGDYMIVCYFTNWAMYRQGMRYTPQDIDSNLCTHIIYGFAVLDPESLLIKVFDTWADIDNKMYEQVVALKAKGIKVSIAIGGWNDSLGNKYSRLVSNPESRARFVRNVVEFIKRYNFDGLDLDWEYPKCWQVDCSMGPASDKPNFSALVRELKEAFRPYGYLLSAAVSPSKTVVDEGYDVPILSRYLDWIAVMTYDFHGQWDKKTGHVAPLFFHEEDDFSYFNSNYSLNYWISKGADRKKIVMGMPMYGQSFTLNDPSNTGLNSPATAGTQGVFTKAPGFLAYYEICNHVQRDGWTLVQDPSGAIGPYAYKGNQWVSFDDAAMIAKKSRLVRELGLGGGMIWALDLDDFRNTCGQGRYPLLSTIRNILGRSPGEPEPAPSHPVGAQQPQPIVTRPPQAAAAAVGTGPSQVAVVVASGTGPVRPTTTQAPSAAGAHPGIENDVCSDEPFRPHPTDCTKYYQCLYGRYLESRCPPGTFWNKNRCDWTCGNTLSGEPGSGSGSQPMTTTTTSRPTWTQPQPTTSTSAPWTQPAPTTSRPPWTQPASTTSRPPWTQPPQTTSRPPWNPPSSSPIPNGSGQVTMPSNLPVPPRPNCPAEPAKPEWGWEPATATEPNTARPLDVPNSDYKVVCYFTNWAWYRPGQGKYKPSDIDFNLCTHIAYGFAVLDSTNLVVKPHDGWADLDNKFYRQVIQLKARGLKVVLAIGGWNDSLGDKYSRLVNNPAARARFITHMIEFLEKHCFDGLDLDWEYPKCWQVDCNKGPDSDKEAFAAFVRELSEAFRPRGLLLSSAVSPSKTVIDQGYDVPTMSRYMDWISVMTYDFHGQWDKKTGHVAPMYLHEEDDNVFFNTNYTINYWINQGADPKKIIMGMPMYGQSFTLVDPKNNGLNAISSGGGTQGEFTRQSGFLSYYEICRNILQRGWKVVQDDSKAMGPYAYSGNQWVSFDDINMIQRKSQYIKDMKLGGGMIWALDLDDFRNTCDCGRHPLLKTINRVLRNYGDSETVRSCMLS